MIYYPKDWGVYPWSDKSLTFHFNTNKTSAGIVSVNIDIYSVAETDYTRLNYIKPGTVLFDQSTNEYTTKISSLLIDHQEAIKYTLVKPIATGTQYETNYIVLKDGEVYKISLVTVDSISQQNYTKIFEMMVNTLRFNK